MNPKLLALASKLHSTSQKVSQAIDKTQVKVCSEAKNLTTDQRLEFYIATLKANQEKLQSLTRKI